MRVDWCVSSWFRIKNTHSHTWKEEASSRGGNSSGGSSSSGSSGGGDGWQRKWQKQYVTARGRGAGANHVLTGPVVRTARKCVLPPTLPLHHACNEAEAPGFGYEQVRGDQGLVMSR